MKNWERERYQKPRIQTSSQLRRQLPRFPTFSRETESENSRTSVAQAEQPLSHDNMPRAPEFFDDGGMRIENSGELELRSIPVFRASSVPPSQPFRMKPDWDKHKVAIFHLYQNEKRPLVEVMHIMTQKYGFVAS